MLIGVGRDVTFLSLDDRCTPPHILHYFSVATERIQAVSIEAFPLMKMRDILRARGNRVPIHVRG